MNNTILFLIIALPRSLYILFTDQIAGDSPLYFRIASNILNGCGFSDSSSFNVCEPIVGGYFPAYPYFIALLQLIGFSEKGIAVIVGVFFALSTLYLRKALELTTRNSKISVGVALVVGLSPLTMGWARLLLIEPVMAIFSVLLLSQCLLIWLRRNVGTVMVGIAILGIATYFKPTSAIFFLPITITLFWSFDYKKFFKIFLISIFSLIIAILPWELRNWSLNGDSVLALKSNLWKDDKYYSSWVHTWSITEYERAYARFPILTGAINQATIEANLFLSKAEANQAHEIIQRHLDYSNVWDINIDNEFHNLLIEKQLKTSHLSLMGLRVLQMSSLVLHPANSWGFPISLTPQQKKQGDSRFVWHTLDFNLAIIFLSKGFLFLYRALVVALYLFFTYKAINEFISKYLGRSYQPENNIQLINNDLNRFLFTISFSLIFSSLIFFVVLLSGLEHRYLSPVMLWLEAAISYHILVISLTRDSN